MEWIEYKGKRYPKFQSLGNASQFAIPFALHYCKGVGYDIGFSKLEWKFPGAIGIDLSLQNGFHADLLPEEQVDYIYSSHCLEHLDCWYRTLKYWISKIKSGGILFLYLPDISNVYWRPWHNEKHKTILTPEILVAFLKDQNITEYLVSDVDLNSSFIVIAQIP
jgi:hypothetical protein